MSSHGFNSHPSPPAPCRPGAGVTTQRGRAQPWMTAGWILYHKICIKAREKKIIEYPLVKTSSVRCLKKLICSYKVFKVFTCFIPNPCEFAFSIMNVGCKWLSPFYIYHSPFMMSAELHCFLMKALSEELHASRMRIVCGLWACPIMNTDIGLSAFMMHIVNFRQDHISQPIVNKESNNQLKGIIFEVCAGRVFLCDWTSLGI